MKTIVACEDRKEGRSRYLTLNWKRTNGRYYLTNTMDQACVFPTKQEAVLAFEKYQRAYGKLVYQASYYAPEYMECAEAVS